MHSPHTQRLLAAIRLGDPVATERFLAEARRRNDPLGPLVERCAGMPSAEAWWRLCVELDDAQSLDVEHLDLLDALLARWPAELRVAPLRWVEAATRGEGPFGLALARVLFVGGAQWARELLASPLPRRWANSLHALHLRACGLTDADLHTLAGQHLPAIHTLDLARNALTADGLCTLSTASWWPQLETLALSRNRLAEPTPPRTTAKSARPNPTKSPPQADSPTPDPARLAAALTSLDLGHNHLSDDGLARLAPLLGAPTLKRLGLGGNALSATDTLRAFLSQPQALEALDLSAANLGDARLEPLLRGLGTANLRDLGLSGNRLGTPAVLALLRHDWPALQRLDLSHNRLDSGALQALLEAQRHGVEAPLRALVTLELGHNRLGDAGASLLAAAALPALLELDVSHNRVGPGGAESLAALVGQESQAAAKAGPVEQQNPIQSPESGAGFCSPSDFSRSQASMRLKLQTPELSCLGLSSNDLSERGARTLAFAQWRCERVFVGDNRVRASDEKRLREAYPGLCFQDRVSAELGVPGERLSPGQWAALYDLFPVAADDPRAAVKKRIVYHGVQGAGKRSNLQALIAASGARGQQGRNVVTHDTQSYTLDLLSPNARWALELSFCTSSEGYSPARIELVEQADGVVFVADSSAGRLPANLVHWQQLRQLLLARDEPVPVVLQLNRRDAADALTVEELTRVFNPRGEAIVVEANAAAGVGVVETLVELVRRFAVQAVPTAHAEA